MASETVSVHDEQVVHAVGVPCLVRVLRCDRPLDASERIDLTRDVVIGRGDCTVRIPDDAMSTSHLRIVREARKLLVEDLGSKNGTAVNGQHIERRELADGDVVEAGHTFFVFRARVPATTWDGEPPTFVAALARQLEAAMRVARSRVPVVVLGETGTGKELVARELHLRSERTGPFVVASDGELAEAEGGTLFVDEVTRLPERAQLALLRMLDEDVRIVAASTVPLDTLRADLFARLVGLNVRLPALRDRREDLGLLVAAAIRRLAREPERVRLSRRATRALFAYGFSRNVRELEKALEVAFAQSDKVELEHLPEAIRSPQAAARADEDDQRRARLIALLTEHHGRIADVARAMGKARMQIHRWIHRYGLELDAYRR